MREGGAAAVIVLALIAVSPVAQADQGSWSEAPDVPDVATPQINDPISETELEDLKTLASQEGMSLQAAIDRYAWNDNFALAVATIRESFPEDFTSAEIVSGEMAWVAFANAAPDKATEIAHAFEMAHPSVAVELRAGLGLNEVEIENAVASVHYAVVGAANVRDATTSFDLETRTITSVVALEDGVDEARLDELRAAAIDSLGTGELRRSITVVLVRSDLLALGGTQASNVHIGGEILSGCTSGFAVKAVFGPPYPTGVSTAGHCSGIQVDDGVSLTFVGGHIGIYGDFKWFTGPQGEPDDFYAGSTSTLEVNRRDVAAVGAPVVGQSLCKNGYAGFKDCGQVIQLNVCEFGACNLVQMDAHRAEDGDSGGPYYWANTAYGLHTGWRFDPFPPYSRDLFSRADLIDDGVYAYIQTCCT